MTLEEAKQRRLEELQKKVLEQQNNVQEQATIQQIEHLKSKVLQKYLTKEARERLNNLRIGHPELAEQIEMLLLQAAQYGQLKEVIDDQKLKELLLEINQGKKQFNIKK